MKTILTKLPIQLKTLFFALVLFSTFSIGINLGEHRKLKKECGEIKDCSIKALILQGSLIQPINKK
jgi:hypothetical protein